MFKIEDREVLVILFKEKIQKINLCFSEQNKIPVKFAINKSGSVEYASFLLFLNNKEN